MEKFIYSYPTKVYFGEGIAADSLRKELPNMGNTVMLAYGGGSIIKNGIYAQVKGILESAGKEVVDFPGITPNPTYAKAQEGALLAKKRKVDFIVAVGGGSVTDCCKVISAQAKLEEDIWDMEYAGGKFPFAGIPFGAIVTASGTGAEMNSGAVITYEEKCGKGQSSAQARRLPYLTHCILLRFLRYRCFPALLILSATLWKPILEILTRIMFQTMLRLRSCETR